MEVERLELGAKDGGIARCLREKAEARPQDDEDQSEAAKLGREQPPAETVDRQHEHEGAGNPGEVIGGDQREMKQRGQMAEQQIETEQKDATMRLARVGIGPEPGAVRTLPHLREVSCGVVGDEEEAGEMMARRRPGVGQQIRQKRERRDGRSEAEGKGEPRSPAGGRAWTRPV